MRRQYDKYGRQQNFVFHRFEDSPFTLSIPHNGMPETQYDGFYDARTGKRVVTEEDTRAWDIAQTIYQPHGACSIVFGLLPRKLVDYNRALDSAEDPEDPALIDTRLMGDYEQYHRTITDSLKLGKSRYGWAVLLDIHGFTKQPECGTFDIVLGTAHRTTCCSETDNRLATWLQNAGYTVFLPGTERALGEKFVGGYTIRHHVWHQNVAWRQSIDAIQIEFSPRFRIEEGHEIERAQLANVFHVFFEEEKKYRSNHKSTL